MPQVLHCGHCLAGQTRTVVFKCDNFGGEGNFKLFPLQDSIQDNNEVVSNVLASWQAGSGLGMRLSDWDIIILFD